MWGNKQKIQTKLGELSFTLAMAIDSLDQNNPKQAKEKLRECKNILDKLIDKRGNLHAEFIHDIEDIKRQLKKLEEDVEKE